MKRLFSFISIIFFSIMVLFSSKAFGELQSEVVRSIRMSSISGIWSILLKIDGIELLIIPFLMALSYFFIWVNFIHGEPKKVIAPAFYPPRDIEISGEIDPGTTRYVISKKLDIPCFDANLLNLAVKGYIHIEQEPSNSGIGEISFLTRTDKIITDNLTDTEALLLKELFYEDNKILLTNDLLFSSEDFIRSEIKTREFGDRVFTLNREYWIISIVFMLLLPVLGYISYAPMRIILSISVIIYIYYSKLDRIVKKWSYSLSFTIRRLLWAILSSHLVYPFTRTYSRFVSRWLFYPIGAIILFPLFFSIYWIFQDREFLLCLCAAGFLCYLLVLLLKKLFPKYTKSGQKLIVAAEGLKLYMTTERSRIEFLEPPEDTPQVYERLIPWALAFGITKIWENRFRDLIDNDDYNPAWYSKGKNRDMLLYGKSANRIRITKSTLSKER